MPEYTAPVLGVPGGLWLQGLVNGMIAGGSLGVLAAVYRHNASSGVSSDAGISQPGQLRTGARQNASGQDDTSPRPGSLQPAGTALPYTIKDILGIGTEYDRRLRDLGVTDLEYLLIVGATPADRRDLAAALAVSPKLVDAWVCQAGFIQLPGVGPHYARLLAATEVASVRDLASRDATILHQLLRLTNYEQSVVQRTPPFSTVQQWIQAAQQVTPHLTH
jgi:predicted flap endonuclease-1-like 5' DNA nuclease